MEAVTVEPATPAAPEQDLAPITANQRIEALDVVRGFALLGIFLMNIEYFNRTLGSLNQGMPRGLTGINWFASWFIAYFVQGKFWTIFSLLFGMGFAVMMTRAAQAGREFKTVYLRRVLALAAFGAAHFILLWEGDILFSYAVAALMLMIVLYGRTKWILIGIGLAAGLAFIPNLGEVAAVAVGLAIAGLLAIHLRSGKHVTIRRVAVPLFSFLLLLIGSLVVIAAAVFWLLPNGPVEPRMPLSIFGPLLVIAGWLSWKYYEPEEKRSVRLAVSIYLFLGFAITAGGLIQRFGPDPDAGVVASAQTPANDEAAKRAAERKAEREKNLAEAKENEEKERRIFTAGSYWDAVKWRAGRFPEKVAGDFGFGVVLVGMFLLGTWFVRSGVMENTGAHLPFFRALAGYGLPVGIGLGLLGSLIAVSHTMGDRYDGWGIAMGLSVIGNLPACLGYVGSVVLMLHSATAFSRIRVLGPLGRMALTNYLTQSLIGATFFYGYALGYWGMPRAQQVLFVIVVYSAQIVFSHWWLSRFHYGPMEWLWRGFTYWQVPQFRRQ
jgi:uncharacterized membrane protein YeiB